MKKAFSMIEMIFAIAVIGILAGIAIPKMMANRNTAEIVQLQEQVEAIRKGIEAYAGNSYIETGVKKYPEGLCVDASNSVGSCNYALNNKKPIFSVVLNNPPIAKKNWDGWTNSVTNETFIYELKTGVLKGYIFQYNKTDGTFKCLDSYGTCGKGCALPCKDLGE